MSDLFEDPTAAGVRNPDVPPSQGANVERASSAQPPRSNLRRLALLVGLLALAGGLAVLILVLVGGSAPKSAGIASEPALAQQRGLPLAGSGANHGSLAGHPGISLRGSSAENPQPSHLAEAPQPVEQVRADSKAEAQAEADRKALEVKKAAEAKAAEEAKARAELEAAKAKAEAERKAMEEKKAAEAKAAEQAKAAEAAMALERSSFAAEKRAAADAFAVIIGKSVGGELFSSLKEVLPTRYFAFADAFLRGLSSLVSQAALTALEQFCDATVQVLKSKRRILAKVLAVELAGTRGPSSGYIADADLILGIVIDSWPIVKESGIFSLDTLKTLSSSDIVKYMGKIEALGMVAVRLFTSPELSAAARQAIKAYRFSETGALVNLDLSEVDSEGKRVTLRFSSDSGLDSFFGGSPAGVVMVKEDNFWVPEWFSTMVPANEQVAESAGALFASQLESGKSDLAVLTKSLAELINMSDAEFESMMGGMGD